MDVYAEPENVQKTPIPHDILWLHDGNVVLATDSYLFKVHNSVLSMHPSVFRDMFELPTVDGAHANTSGAGMMPELYEGLPLVKLAGDKGEDVAHLLRAVYERQYYRIDNDDTPLEVIIALLLLSTKYDFEHIRRDVIAHISKYYPMTLAACDAFEDHDIIFGQDFRTAHFSLLQALHSADVEALLPAAYYYCTDYDIDLVYGKEMSLGPECFRSLVRGKMKLTHDLNRLLATVPGELIEQSGVHECPKEGNGVRFNDLDVFVDNASIKHAEGSVLVENCLEGLCDNCKGKLTELINKRRKFIWDKIPKLFGFQGWDVCHSELKAILSPEHDA